MDFGCFSAAACADCQSRLARNEITETKKGYADNCRNMQTSSARKEQITKLRSRYCKLQNADSCNKRQSSNTGAAVLAPLGAFGSAAPLRGAGRSECIVRLLPVPVRLQKPPVATALPADPPKSCPDFRPWPPHVANFVDFKPTFRRSKTHQKSDSSKTLPKP